MSLEASCDTHDTYPVSKHQHRLPSPPDTVLPLAVPSPSVVPPPEDSELPKAVPRKSGKNTFSKHLRQVNTQLFRLNGKATTESETKSETKSESESSVVSTSMVAPCPPDVVALHFDRLVLKLVPRELTKFMQLLAYFEADPYYDSVEAIVGFTRENYIARRNIHRDDDHAASLVRGHKKRSGHIPE